MTKADDGVHGAQRRQFRHVQIFERTCRHWHDNGFASSSCFSLLLLPSGSQQTAAAMRLRKQLNVRGGESPVLRQPWSYAWSCQRPRPDKRETKDIMWNKIKGEMEINESDKWSISSSQFLLHCSQDSLISLYFPLAFICLTVPHRSPRLQHPHTPITLTHSACGGQNSKGCSMCAISRGMLKSLDSLEGRRQERMSDLVLYHIREKLWIREKSRRMGRASMLLNHRLMTQMWGLGLMALAWMTGSETLDVLEFSHTDSEGWSRKTKHPVSVSSAGEDRWAQFSILNNLGEQKSIAEYPNVTQMGAKSIKPQRLVTLN